MIRLPYNNLTWLGQNNFMVALGYMTDNLLMVVCLTSKVQLIQYVVTHGSLGLKIYTPIWIDYILMSGCMVARWVYLQLPMIALIACYDVSHGN